MRNASLERLDHVHPQLASVILEAARQWERIHSDMRVEVTSGLRSEEEQRALYRAGKTRALQGQHVVGRAVDVAIIDGEKALWTFGLYRLFNSMVQCVAARYDVSIGWGGDWAIRDGVHFYFADSDEWTIPTAMSALTSDIGTRPAKDRAARDTKPTDEV